MIQMKILFSYNINKISICMKIMNEMIELANIFDFINIRYFCVSNNPDLRVIKAMIDDRLFKIKHCQDINNIERKLSLYELIIDPELLIQMIAIEFNLSNVLNDLNSSLSNYRFNNLL